VLKEACDKVYIEKGTKDKTILKVEKKGHSGYKAHNGDLYITVFVEENAKFKVDGNNVYSEHELEYVTAVCGGPIQIETVSGMKEVVINPGTQSGA
jgi:DnaJ-class molecular chaperone